MESRLFVWKLAPISYLPVLSLYGIVFFLYTYIDFLLYIDCLWNEIGIWVAPIVLLIFHFHRLQCHCTSFLLFSSEELVIRSFPQKPLEICCWQNDHLRFFSFTLDFRIFGKFRKIRLILKSRNTLWKQKKGTFLNLDKFLCFSQCMWCTFCMHAISN